jgi:hypothetical protein
MTHSDTEAKMSIDTEAVNYLRRLINEGFEVPVVEGTDRKLGATVGQHLHRDAQNWIQTKLCAETQRYVVEETTGLENFNDTIADALTNNPLVVVLVRNEHPRYFAGLKPKSKDPVFAHTHHFAKPIPIECHEYWEKSLRQAGHIVFAKWEEKSCYAG